MTSLLRRPSRDPSDNRRQSFGLGHDLGQSTNRRHSLWNPLHIDQDEFNKVKFDADAIRRNVFGPPLSEIQIGGVDSTVCRPTTASARRSVIWSRERQLYESQTRQKHESFNKRPYMTYDYPELGKHYPGTWRTATSGEMDHIVRRLTRPTALSNIRAESAVRTRAKSAPATSQQRTVCTIKIENEGVF